MSGRVLNFEGSMHSQVLRLLPWYVNGTLDVEESQRVHRHLAECARCRDEFDELRQLQGYCTRADGMGDEARLDATASFARLRGRLQRERQQQRARPQATLSPRWEGLRRSWAQAPAWLRFALAAQFCAVFALAGVLVGQQRGPSSMEARYRTLGDAPTPASRDTAGREAELVVVFAPGVSHAQMQRLLRTSRARIVDGPNDAGAYVLTVPWESREAALQRLRREPGVATVENLDAGDRR